MLPGMKRLALAAGLLIASPVMAQEFPLRGQWEVRLPNSQYVAIVLIDAERRVTWDSPSDQGKPAKYFGYVSSASGTNLVITLTNREGVTKTHCTVSNDILMHCYTIRADGSRSANTMLVKVGSGPLKLNRPSL